MIDNERKCLYIASEVRSGSTYIAESLAYDLASRCGFELWDLAKEKFSSLGEDSTHADILRIWSELYLDSSGFAASKVMCKALSVIYRCASVSDHVRHAFFGNHSYWVVIRRRDRLKQAISLAMAIKTGLYHYYGDVEQSADRNASLSNNEIDTALRMVCLSDVFLETFAARLPSDRVVSVFYEDFMFDEVGYLNRVHTMCGFPGVDNEHYVQSAKLKKTASEAKSMAYLSFGDWFLSNYV